MSAAGDRLNIFSLVHHFSSLAPSLWETARYRLIYCLKGPLSPKQPTNQIQRRNSILQTFSSVASYKEETNFVTSNKQKPLPNKLLWIAPSPPVIDLPVENRFLRSLYAAAKGMSLWIPVPHYTCPIRLFPLFAVLDCLECRLSEDEHFGNLCHAACIFLCVCLLLIS